VPAPRLPAWSAFQGVGVPSSRHQPSASLRRDPTLVAVRPRRFSRPRRFHPLPALRVCFTPQPRSGFSHEKLISHSRSGSSPSRALSSLAKVRCTGCPMRHVPSPRPQGFDLYESSGALATVISRRMGPRPRGSLLLQVFALAAVGAPSRPFRSWP